MKSPYPEVSAKNPFFYVTVSGVDLSAITGLGDVRLQVYRVQHSDIPLSSVDYTPLEQRKNKFTFVLDNSVFSMDGGRFQADLYVLDSLMASTYFTYNKAEPTLVGSTNV